MELRVAGRELRLPPGAHPAQMAGEGLVPRLLPKDRSQPRDRYHSKLELLLQQLDEQILRVRPHLAKLEPNRLERGRCPVYY